MQPAKSLTASRASACVPASTSCVNRIRDYCTIKNIPRRIIPEDGGDVLVALTPACYIAMRIGIRRSHRPHLSLSLRHPRRPIRLSFSLYLSFSLSLPLYPTRYHESVCVREIVCACPSPASAKIHASASCFRFIFLLFQARGRWCRRWELPGRPVIIVKTSVFRWEWLRTTRRIIQIYF